MSDASPLSNERCVSTFEFVNFANMPRGAGRGRGHGKVQRKKSLPPQGSGASKRTPPSHFDAANGDDMYMPELIVAKRKAKSICPCNSCESNNGKMESQWQVEWAGHADKHNTWEPLVHLCGNEQMIKTFRLELKKKNEAFAKKVEQAKQKKKDKEASKKLAQTVAAAAAEDSDGSDFSNHSTATLVQVDSDADYADADADSSGGSRAKQKPKRAIKSSVWSVYDVHDAYCKEKMATCTYDKGGGKVCGKRIRFKSGTSGMWNHLQYCHTNAYVHLKEESRARKPVLGGTVSGMVITERKRAELHSQHAVWLVKHKRPFSTVDDKEYRNLWGIAYSGAYTPPTKK